MSRADRNRALLATFASIFAALTVAVALAGSAGAAGEDLVVQPSVGSPARIMLGAAPEELSGEAWATARSGSGIDTLARYTDGGGWETLPAPTSTVPGGERIIFLEGSGVGRTTAGGAVAVAAVQDVEGEPVETLVVRDPGGQPRQAADATPLLEAEAEGRLFGLVDGQVLLAAREEAGRAGAFVVPESLQRVLRYDGETWSSEPLCLEAEPICVAVEPGFEAVAIAAASGEGWLLGSSPGNGLELFRRQNGGPGGPVWLRQPLGPANSLGARLAQAAPGGVAVSTRTKGQPLTATADGVWIDYTVEGTQSATAYYDIAAGEVTASWCDGPGSVCTRPLEYSLQSGQGRSFAWPPSAGSGPYGTRTLTGVGAGAILTLEGEAFRRLTFVGGDAGASAGAALNGPEEGWLGASPPLQLTRNPTGSGVQSWPVPFRRPLTAIATRAGGGVGLGTEALAVGENGQVARYVPGAGWEPEALLRSSGKRATPTLRGVAWPVDGLAYAVGDENAMWRWQKATGLWQVDPGAPANLARANFTAIAFDPSDPQRGYAVGKQGLLLGFGREWKQEELPAEIPSEANFSSVAFAGPEAIATWKYPVTANRYSGGVIVNDGTGWRVDTGATAALGGAFPQRVAGLPDGGAAIATLATGEAGQQVAGRLLIRQGAGAPWEQSASGLPGYPTALAAIREAGVVRTVLSVSSQSQGSAELSTDSEQIENQPPPGQAPLLTAPYPLPASGVVLRQTATGWRDEQRQQYPLPPNSSGQTEYDLPVRPDPVLALLSSPDGSAGWALGGETATNVTFLGSQVKTAFVGRFGADAAPPNAATSAPIDGGEGAVFALGGNAQCAAACADYAGAGIGPDRWLPAAVTRAATVPGVRAFLYTGASVAATNGRPAGEVPLASALSSSEFGREQAAYARRLGDGAGALPVFAAPAESDLDAAGSLETFRGAFAGFSQPFGTAPAPAGLAPVKAAGPGSANYSFDSDGSGGAVRVVVLDYSRPTLGDAQRCWLAQELAAARQAERPAIVIGQRDLSGLAPNAAADRTQVVQTLVGVGAPAGCAVDQLGGASAYFFDFPEENRFYRLSAGGRGLDAYGSGTLGFVSPPASTDTAFAGASGFLVVNVKSGQRNPTTNVAPVGVRLIPSIGSLALDATDGTLLRRSQPALFEGLARRVQAGSMCSGSGGSAPSSCEVLSPPPYVPIPSRCQGSNCATSLFPQYTFTSSEPDIADFVAADPASSNPRSVLLVNKKPVLDSSSGLLCAFNAGSTIVTVAAGGVSYSQKVTVLAGSVQQPCGTTPLRNRPTGNDNAETPPGPGPTPNGQPLPNDTPPPPPPPPTVAQPQSVPPTVQKPPPVGPPPPAAFIPLLTTAAVPLVPIVPPPPLPAVQPTPPSGTSQVNAVEEEEEPEEATEASSAFAALPAPGPASVTYAGDSGGGLPILLPAAALILAIAAAAIGSGRGRARPAFQTSHANRRYR